jgi:hypothetical protein
MRSALQMKQRRRSDGDAEDGGIKLKEDDLLGTPGTQNPGDKLTTVGRLW